MRARQPDQEGFVERDGVKVAYEVYGDGAASVFLVAASPITHARSWKGLIPFLARHLTVVTIDGPGTGRSDRPHERDRYRPDEIAADLIGVLDAAGSEQTVVIAHCHAVPWALRLAADVPRPRRRARGDLAGHRRHAGVRLHRRSRAALAGGRRRRRRLGDAQPPFWRREGGYRAWVEFFFDQLLPEPHSTKQLEDTVAWALDTEAEAMIAEREGRRRHRPHRGRRAVRTGSCPVLVIHGTDDRCQPLARGRRVAELTGGELVVLDGSGPPAARREIRCGSTS